MKIDHFKIFHLRLPLVFPFETSFGKVTHNETLIVKISSQGLDGWGECSAGRAPLYSGETVGTCWHIIDEFLAPMIKQNNFTTFRGNNMAKAGVEMALWDLKAKLSDKPLYKLLGATQKRIPVGISLGIEPTIRKLIKRIEYALAKKYHRIKLKIKCGWDIKMLRSVRKEFPRVKLWADANGAYTLSNANHLKHLDKFNLVMLEQPLDYEDYVDHAKLSKTIATPICLDESIKSPADGRKAIELGSCKFINIKQARVGGTTNAISLHDIAKKHSIPVWCGGLLETGIGRAHNIALAGLPNFRLPGDISESSRYYSPEIIDPPVELTKDGFINMPSGAGIGFAVNQKRLLKYCLQSKKLF